MIIGGLVVHPFARAAEALTFLGRATCARHRTSSSRPAVLMTGPDGNKACGIAAAYAGDLAEARGS